ncbi:MAG: glycosyltransferase, partial [Bacteroidota bacterium]
KAQLFLYPSLFEGFGIPIIEALFSKTPVITSNCSSMPEAGGPDAILINPNDPGEIAQAIDTILTDSNLREEMVEKGYLYAQRFRGEALTEDLVNIYEQLL